MREPTASTTCWVSSGRPYFALEGRRDERCREVRNNPSESRYEVWADGQLAGYTQYVVRPGRVAFLHTEVHEPYEGQGLGGQLARSALDDARARGLLVMPFCPFIAAYIEGHLDEYGDLVAPEMLSGDRDHEPEPSPK